MNTPKAVDSPEAIADDRRRIRRKALWLLFWGSPVLFVILFYTVENWRGARAWKKCQEEMAAKGEKLDSASFIPPEIPKEQNFGAAPVFQKVFDEPGDRWKGPVPKPSLSTGGREVELPKSNWMAGERILLSDWQAYYLGAAELKEDAWGTNAAEGVLRVLQRFDPILDEIRQYSSRPLSRYPVKYNLKDPFETRIPHLPFSREVVNVLGLKSRAHLELGQVDTAAGDVDLMLRLVRSHEQDLMLISWLVSITEMDIAQRAIWEGLETHQWSDGSLQRWQKIFSQIDHSSNLIGVMRAERAGASDMLLSICRDPGIVADIGSNGADSDRADYWVMRLIPKGWYQMERTSLVRLHQEKIIDPILKDRAAGIGILAMMDGLGDGLKSALSKGNAIQKMTEHRIFATMLMGVIPEMFSKAARAQTMAQLTATACALERHRLATGGYPETLDELLPTIKSDLIQKSPPWEKFKYRKTADGHFLLYSVGLNQKDDGGEVIRKGTTVDFESGDLVWPVAKPVVSPEKKAEETAR